MGLMSALVPGYLAVAASLVEAACLCPEDTPQEPAAAVCTVTVRPAADGSHKAAVAAAAAAVAPAAVAEPADAPADVPGGVGTAVVADGSGVERQRGQTAGTGTQVASRARVAVSLGQLCVELSRHLLSGKGMQSKRPLLRPFNEQHRLRV